MQVEAISDSIRFNMWLKPCKTASSYNWEDLKTLQALRSCFGYICPTLPQISCAGLNLHLLRSAVNFME